MVDHDPSISLEALIQVYKEMTQRIAKMEEERKEIGRAILQQMTTKSLSIAGYIVRSCERLNIHTELEKAREWGATRMEEVIDKAKLKQLYQAGCEIPGISISQFIQVSIKSPDESKKAS